MGTGETLTILELNFERTWRGGERQTLYNMTGFRNRGVQVDLLCRRGVPLEEKARAEGFTVYSFDNILGALFFLVFRSGRYGVLHAQTSHILTYCVFTKPFHRAKVVFTRRVDFVPHGGLTRLKYKLTDEIIAVSTAVKTILENFISTRKVSVISDIAVKKELDKERALEWLRALEPAGGIHIIGTTAALVQHKDPLNMVEAVYQVSKRRNDFVFLHFGGGDLEDKVKEKIMEYNLERVYKLMGFRENVEDIFSILEVFVMSSEEEGLGSSVLDAFLYKVPAVVTDAGGLTDLVVDGRGIIGPKHSPQMLADGIDLLLKEPELAGRLAENAFDYVMTYHNLEYITDQYMALFR